MQPEPDRPGAAMPARPEHGVLSDGVLNDGVLSAPGPVRPAPQGPSSTVLKPRWPGSSAARWVVQLPRRVLIGAVQAYRLLLKAWIGNACRFEPSCSAYALQALERHGAVAGSYLTVARLARCHPWCTGGHDPVPAVPPGLFSRLGLGARPPEPPHDPG